VNSVIKFECSEDSITINIFWGGVIELFFSFTELCNIEQILFELLNDISRFFFYERVTWILN
jgi:hypothetical protein